MSDRQQTDKKKREAQTEVRNVGLGVTIPTTLAASVIVGCVIGHYLDKWLGTGPWMLLLFLVLGIAAGIRQMLLILRKMEDKGK